MCTFPFRGFSGFLLISLVFRNQYMSVSFQPREFAAHTHSLWKHELGGQLAMDPGSLPAGAAPINRVVLELGQG